MPGEGLGPAPPGSGGSPPEGCAASQGLGHAVRLTTMYAAFNSRDLDAVLAALAPDVDWPNAWEGGRIHGPEAVGQYWRRQWAVLDPTVQPQAVTERRDGSTEVVVHQVVRDLSGAVVLDQTVRHVYRFTGDLVQRMDVEDSA